MSEKKKEVLSNTSAVCQSAVGEGAQINCCGQCSMNMLRRKKPRDSSESLPQILPPIAHASYKACFSGRTSFLSVARGIDRPFQNHAVWR